MSNYDVRAAQIAAIRQEQEENSAVVKFTVKAATAADTFDFVPFYGHDSKEPKYYATLAEAEAAKLRAHAQGFNHVVIYKNGKAMVNV